MRRLSTLCATLALSSMSAHALSIGGGLGMFGADVSKAKMPQPNTWSLSSPTWSVKGVDPTGSMLGILGTPSDKNQSKTTPYSSGSTVAMELVWIHGGTVDYTLSNAVGAAPFYKGSDDDFKLFAYQFSVSENITAWNELGGIPLSVVPYWKFRTGYMDFEDVGANVTTLDVAMGFWYTLPFGAAVVYDAPLGISVRTFAGYDPVTGLISLMNKNVHQSWEYGAGVEWAVRPWLVAEAGIDGGSTNVDNSVVYALKTSVLNFGARINFDGF
jgi:hypothetical protein